MPTVKIIFEVFNEVTERQTVTFPSSLFVEIIGIERIGFTNFFFNHNTTLLDGKNTIFTIHFLPEEKNLRAFLQNRFLCFSTSARTQMFPYQNYSDAQKRRLLELEVNERLQIRGDELVEDEDDRHHDEPHQPEREHGEIDAVPAFPTVW